MSLNNQEMQICQLKSELDSISDNLVLQHQEMPEIYEEHKQQYEENHKTLMVARSLNEQHERLKQEEVRLSATRVQLLRECEALRASVQKETEQRAQLEEELRAEYQEHAAVVEDYEKTLQEIAAKLRKWKIVYDENKVKELQNQDEAMNNKLEKEKAEEQEMVENLRRKLKGMHGDVPENITDVLGKKQRATKLKALADKRESLIKKRNEIGNSKLISN